MKIFITFFAFLCMAFIANAQETITANVDKENVTISNKNISANCCSVFTSDYFQDGYNITLTEIDTAKVKCKCMCIFDYDMKLSSLKPGKYTVEIKRQEFKKYSYPIDTIYTVGKTEFEIIVGLAMPPVQFSYIQSDCLTNSVNDNNSLENRIEIFPNPTKDLLSVSLDNGINVNSWRITDVNGKLLKSSDMQNKSSNFQIDIRTISSGNYLLELITNQGLISKRFSVVR